MARTRMMLKPVPPADMTAVEKCPLCRSFGKPAGLDDRALWFDCGSCGTSFAAVAGLSLGATTS